MPKKSCVFSDGTRVMHTTYGTGTVLSHKQGWYNVRYDNGSTEKDYSKNLTLIESENDYMAAFDGDGIMSFDGDTAEEDLLHQGGMFGSASVYVAPDNSEQPSSPETVAQHSSPKKKPQPVSQHASPKWAPPPVSPAEQAKAECELKKIKAETQKVQMETEILEASAKLALDFMGKLGK